MTGAVGIIFAGYNSMFFFIIKGGIIESSGYDTCVYTVDMTGALDIVDSILCSFGPFTFVFITNLPLCSNSLDQSSIVDPVQQNQQTKLLLNLPPGRQLWLSLFPLHF